MSEGAATRRDIKEIVGMLMRIADGGEITPDEVTTLVSTPTANSKRR